MTVRTDSELRELAEKASAEYAEASAGEALAWVARTFGDRWIVASNMQDAVLIDLATAYDPTMIGADGLHPTDDGYARLAELFFAVLREQFERPPRLH